MAERKVFGCSVLVAIVGIGAVGVALDHKDWIYPEQKVNERANFSAMIEQGRVDIERIDLGLFVTLPTSLGEEMTYFVVKNPMPSDYTFIAYEQADCLLTKIQESGWLGGLSDGIKMSMTEISSIRASVVETDKEKSMILANINGFETANNIVVCLGGGDENPQLLAEARQSLDEFMTSKSYLFDAF